MEEPKNEKKQVVYATQEDVESLREDDTGSITSQDSYVDLFFHERKLSKGLRARHIGMLTFVGVFGTGLFLSSGGTLAKTGPAGMFICYLIVGLVVGASQMCITEVSCFMPATSGYLAHCHVFDPTLSFMMGWIDVYGSLIPNELSAVSVIMSYWSDINPALWISIFGLIMVAVNAYNIKFYGEVEFVFGILKLTLVFILIICGLVIDLGGTGDRIGFRYWNDPGPFVALFTSGSLGKFAGFWEAISLVVYAYGGVQGVSLLAGETEHPRRAIYRAAKRVFFRVFGLYLATVLILTMIVPSNNKQIASPTGDASASPFVIAMQGQINVLPHYINAIVATSALSAGNLYLIKGSRVLYALAARKQAPKIFLKTNKFGLPWVSVTVVCCFLPLAYMTTSEGAAVVFNWFQRLTASSLLMNWIIISVNHILLMKALKAQGYTRADLPYTFPGTQYAAWFSLFFSCLFLLTGGFANFIHGNFDFGDFFGSYFIIPLALVLFVGYKLITRAKFRKPEEVDLKNIFRDIELHPEPPYPKLKGWEWITVLWA